MLHTQLHGYNENMSNDLEKIQIRIGISGGETMTVTHYDGKTKARWGRDMILATTRCRKPYPSERASCTASQTAA